MIETLAYTTNIIIMHIIIIMSSIFLLLVTLLRFAKSSWINEQLTLTFITDSMPLTIMNGGFTFFSSEKNPKKEEVNRHLKTFSIT